MRFMDVSRSFSTPAGPVNVLKDVSFDIMESDFLMITGPSGSGKSTLLHICALIDKATSGKVILSGRDISAIDERELCALRKESIGLVFQKFCLLPHRNVRDNILFRFRYIEHPPSDMPLRAAEVMKQMGIAHLAERPARLLSSGEQQRAAIARAVIKKPLILLADEPTGNLDSESSKTVMDAFRELNSNGLTIIMVTHNEHLLDYATRRLVCENGRITECAP